MKGVWCVEQVEGAIFSLFKILIFLLIMNCFHHFNCCLKISFILIPEVFLSPYKFHFRCECFIHHLTMNPVLQIIKKKKKGVCRENKSFLCHNGQIVTGLNKTEQYHSSSQWDRKSGLTIVASEKVLFPFPFSW